MSPASVEADNNTCSRSALFVGLLSSDEKASKKPVISLPMSPAFELAEPEGEELRQAMRDHYLPLQGPSFEEWLDNADALGARIERDRIFTFHLRE